MKHLLTVLSLGAAAMTTVCLAAESATPCDPHEHICYLNGVNHSYFANNNWHDVQGMTLHHDASGEPYLSSHKHTGPRPVSFYLGVMSGVQFLHASGADNVQIVSPYVTPDTFSTATSHTNWVYGAYMGLTFHGKRAAWLNGFHPELSVWNTNTTKITGIHQTSIGTPSKLQYQYNLSVRALGLNGIFDAVKWKDLRVMVGGGAELAQLVTSGFKEKLISGAPVDESVADRTDTRVIFDLKAGVGVHFLNHMQANVMYTYYPSFSYSTGGITNLNKSTPWPGIKANMSLQNVAASIAYTF